LVALVPFLGRRIPLKDTSKGSGIKLIPMIFRDINKSYTPEYLKRKGGMKINF